MNLKRVGLVLGAIAGFFIGGSISTPGRSSATVVQGITGGAITENLGGVSFSFALSLIGALFAAVILATIFMSAEEIVKLARNR